MSKIVFFSGSFNPPTIAHKRLLTAAVDGVGADQGIFVPLNDACVNKEMKKTDYPSEVLSESRRSRMLKALCAGDERLSVDEGEYIFIDTARNSIDTMRRVREKYAYAEQIGFLFNEDKLGTFTKWKIFGEFGENCRIIAFKREGFDPEDEIENTKALRELRDRFVILPAPEGIEGISSAAVRDAVREGDDETVKAMLIPEIIELLAGSQIHKETVIRSFRGRYAFLSNFYKADVMFEDMTYPTNEAAFQAAKCLDSKERIPFTEQTNPVIAKRMGRRVNLRPDWERVKAGIMEEIVRAKFTQHPDLAEKLVATGDLPIMEGNNWHDTFWGVDASTGRGENHLGKILMKVRKELGGAGDTSAEVNFSASYLRGSSAAGLTSEGKTSSMIRGGSEAKPSGRQEAEPKAAAPEIVYEAGMKLRHPAFGTGTITAVSGNTASRILDVEFPGVGLKRLGAVWVDKNCTIVSE